MEPKLTPTFFKIISTDYWAQNLFILIFGPWVIYWIDMLIESERGFFTVVLAGIGTVVGGIAFPWRYWSITSTFEHGEETTATIIDIHVLATGKKRKDYTIDYEYEFAGQMYQYRNRVKNNSFSRNLKQNQKVILLVNREKPNIAFIKDIYLEYS